jgi:hypothetical protein
MPISLTYLASNKNLPTLFSNILSARIPDKFTHEFLSKTIGLTGSNDRSFIPLLRTLGFLDPSSTPTASYRLLKNSESASIALAEGIRSAYKPIFEANEIAHTLSGEKLKGLIAQVAGTDDALTSRIANTFNALVKLADFSAPQPQAKNPPEDLDGEELPIRPKTGAPQPGKSMRPEFHYNIQIHLPSNGTEEVYLNIFNALRKIFQ